MSLPAEWVAWIVVSGRDRGRWGLRAGGPPAVHPAPRQPSRLHGRGLPAAAVFSLARAGEAHARGFEREASVALLAGFALMLALDNAFG